MDDYLREIQTAIFRKWISNQKRDIIIFIQVKRIRMRLLLKMNTVIVM